MTCQHKRAALIFLFLSMPFCSRLQLFFSFRLYSRSLVRGALWDWIFLNFLSRPLIYPFLFLFYLHLMICPAAPRLFMRLTYLHFFPFLRRSFHLNSETWAALPGRSRPPTASHLFLSRFIRKSTAACYFSEYFRSPPHRGSVPIHCFILDTYPKNSPIPIVHYYSGRNSPLNSHCNPRDDDDHDLHPHRMVYWGSLHHSCAQHNPFQSRLGTAAVDDHFHG